MTALHGATNNIRGKDKKKHMQPWEKEERVWEGEDGYYISSMTTVADLVQEANLQGHCGGAHFRFIDAKVTYLYSLRDKDGVPKATIHFKPVEFMGKEQPMDKHPNDAAHGNTGSQSYTWLKSTSYDSYIAGKYPDFMWEGRPCRILSVSGRGVWGGTGKGADYRAMVTAWCEANPIKEAKARKTASAVPA